MDENKDKDKEKEKDQNIENESASKPEPATSDLPSDTDLSAKPEEKKIEGSETPQPEEDGDDLTGIEEETEQEIVQKVTKKESRKPRKKKSDRSQDRQKSEGPEWIEKVVQIRRVTKVVKGGKKLSFRAVVIAGNAKGEVGVGVGKASEVIGAIQKGVVDAKKNSIKISLAKTTIPHNVQGRAGAAKVLLKPARQGTGIIAGGSARTVLELGGVGDVLSKSLGSRSPLNVARATINGLSQLRKFNDVAKLRNLSMREMLGVEKF